MAPEAMRPAAATQREAGPPGDDLLESAPHSRVCHSAVEHEQLEIPLSELMVADRLDLYPEVTGRDYFRVFFSRDRLILQPRGFVGLIPINDRVAIEVSPKFAVQNLARLLSIGEHTPISLAPHVRRYRPDGRVIASVLDAMTGRLVELVDDIVSERGHRDYLRTSVDTSLPRGRILVGETLTRHLARRAAHRVAACWFVPTSDTGPNRCLKYALWYLAQRYRRMRPRRGIRALLSALNARFHLFKAAHLDLSRTFLSDPFVADPDLLPSLYSHYKEALNLAKCITRDRGVSLGRDHDEIRMASLLVKMDDALEAYLRNALRLELEVTAPDLHVLDGNLQEPDGGGKPLFDETPSPVATPDIVIARWLPGEGARQPLVVIEVKYQRSPEREALNQAIAYGASYRAPSVVIAHPSSQSTDHGLLPLGTISSMSAYRYAYDLGRRDLKKEEAAMAEAMLKLARTGRAALSL